MLHLYLFIMYLSNKFKAIIIFMNFIFLHFFTVFYAGDVSVNGGFQLVLKCDIEVNYAWIGFHR